MGVNFSFIFAFMFVRQLKHSNGRVYVQVVDKSSGRYRVLKSFGSSTEDKTIKVLIDKAELWIKSRTGIVEFDFENEVSLFNNVLNNITSHTLIGIEQKIFDEIGFNKIEDELFRELVLYRLVYPKSKLKTVEYLYRYSQKQYSEDDIYRYLDKLYNTQKEKVQQISFEHTKSLFEGKISVVFYYVTTIYFEIDNEDELRKTGFSKEGKHQNPQIVLGLLVSKHGYPLAYDIFEGNKFEGHTMLPIIDSFIVKYNLKQPIIVADSGLLSNQNIEELRIKNYEFILGARIKNESQLIKEKILSLNLKNGESNIIKKGDLKLRPIFHRKQKRIEAHICLTFTAYKVYKELERQLKEKKSHLSPEKVIEILQSIYQIEVMVPKTKQIIKKTLLLTKEQKKLNEFFDFGC